MRRSSSLGQKQQTIFELFAGRLRISYVAVCLLFAIIPGCCPQLRRRYSSLDTMDDVAFYMFYVIRYMRSKVVATEINLLPLCPNGEETFHNAFGPISRWKPQLLLWLIIAVINIPYFVRLFRFSAPFTSFSCQR